MYNTLHSNNRPSKYGSNPSQRLVLCLSSKSRALLSRLRLLLTKLGLFLLSEARLCLLNRHNHRRRPLCLRCLKPGSSSR